jgi:hypothetical protein
MVVSFKSVYFGAVSLGLPKGQKFTVVFDTGSGHVIVPSIHCESETCSAHNRYNRSESANAFDVDYDGTVVAPGASRDQITVAFGTGEVTGQFVQESLCLDRAVAVDDAILLNNHSASEARIPLGCVALRVVTATEMTEEPFSSFTFDGVLGLGLDDLALAPEFSFFGMMSSKEMGEEPRLSTADFGVFLADSDDDVSEICFGGYNPDRVGTLSFAPVANPELGYWQVTITAVRVGNRSLSFCDDGQCRAVVDTGTSLLAVPSAFADDLASELEDSLVDPPEDAEGGVDCRRATGSVLEFDVDGMTISLSPGDYSRQAIQLAADAEPGGQDAEQVGDASIHAFEAAAEDLASGGGEQARCHPTIMPIDFPEPLGPKLFIWGEPVLRKYYTTYDWTRKRVGFGIAKQHPSEDEDEELGLPLPGASPLLFL